MDNFNDGLLGMLGNWVLIYWSWHVTIAGNVSLRKGILVPFWTRIIMTTAAANLLESTLRKFLFQHGVSGIPSHLMYSWFKIICKILQGGSLGMHITWVVSITSEYTICVATSAINYQMQMINVPNSAFRRSVNSKQLRHCQSWCSVGLCHPPCCHVQEH